MAHSKFFLFISLLAIFFSTQGCFKEPQQYVGNEVPPPNFSGTPDVFFKFVVNMDSTITKRVKSFNGKDTRGDVGLWFTEQIESFTYMSYQYDSLGVLIDSTLVLDTLSYGFLAAQGGQARTAKVMKNPVPGGSTIRVQLGTDIIELNLDQMIREVAFTNVLTDGDEVTSVQLLNQNIQYLVTGNTFWDPAQDFLRSNFWPIFEAGMNADNVCDTTGYIGSLMNNAAQIEIDPLNYKVAKVLSPIHEDEMYLFSIDVVESSWNNGWVKGSFWKIVSTYLNNDGDNVVDYLNLPLCEFAMKSPGSGDAVPPEYNSPGVLLIEKRHEPGQYYAYNVRFKDSVTSAKFSRGGLVVN